MLIMNVSKYLLIILITFSLSLVTFAMPNRKNNNPFGNFDFDFDFPTMPDLFADSSFPSFDSTSFDATFKDIADSISKINIPEIKKHSNDNNFFHCVSTKVNDEKNKSRNKRASASAAAAASSSSSGENKMATFVSSSDPQKSTQFGLIVDSAKVCAGMKNE